MLTLQLQIPCVHESSSFTNLRSNVKQLLVITRPRVLEITVVVKLCPFSADTDDDDAKISRIQAFHSINSVAKSQIILINKQTSTSKVSSSHCLSAYMNWYQSSFEWITNQKVAFQLLFRHWNVKGSWLSKLLLVLKGVSKFYGPFRYNISWYQPKVS